MCLSFHIPRKVPSSPSSLMNKHNKQHPVGVLYTQNKKQNTF